MMRVTYRFERVVRKATLYRHCKRCSRRFQRTLIAEQTVNPYNKNPDGTVRTHLEVVKAVDEDLRQLMRSFDSGDLVCKKCEAKR